MTQEFSCRFVTAEVRVRSQISRCGICRGLRDTQTGISHSNSTSPCRRDLYLTKHNAHKRQTSMPSAGFEPAIRISELPQALALDHAATGIGPMDYWQRIMFNILVAQPPFYCTVF